MSSSTEEQVAAALAAVRCMLEEEANEEAAITPSRSAWSDAARLLTQDVAPSRLPTPTWGNIERLRRVVRSERG